MLFGKRKSNKVPTSGNAPDYRDASLSPEERAKALLSKLTTEQKLAQLIGKMFSDEPEKVLDELPCAVGEAVIVKQLGSPAEQGNYIRSIVDAVMAKSGGVPPVVEVEAISGALIPGATSFPSAIGLGATFHPETISAMTDIIRRQMVSSGVRRACSPVMDVARDQRWGRVGETYGEDPTLCAAMSTAFVKGLQGDDLSVGAAACGKHFLGYAMGEGGFNSATNSISPKELREVYAKPFQAAITEADLMTVMNSYGAPDGEPVAGSKAILDDLLRGEMDYHGVTISDYGAVTQLIDKSLAADKKEAAIRALGSRLEVELPNPDVYLYLKEALDNGELSIDIVDQAVLDILICKFKLGLFENPYPRTELLEEAFDPANRELSLKTACESIVLLKNDGILPLKKSTKKIAVIGPRGNSVRVMFGGYSVAAGIEMSMGSLLKNLGLSGDEDAAEYYPNSFVRKESDKLNLFIRRMFPSTPTLFDAVKAACVDSEVVFERGCDIAGDDRSGFAAALDLAKSSDIVICAVGGKYGWGEQCTAGEGRDTDNIGLPGIQEELVRLLCESGTPVVIVHGDIRPISSKYAKEHANAIIEQWFPAETGGTATAMVLFGDYNPGGRLPLTCLEHVGHTPLYAGQKRGNVLTADLSGSNFNSFCTGPIKPLWYFGEGRSYTEFEYSDFVCSSSTSANGSINAAISVKNIGTVAGDEVVQLYFSDKVASTLRPAHEFAGLARIHLLPGESKRVEFTMSASQTALVNRDMKWAVEAGEVEIFIGRSSVDFKASGICRITDSALIDGSKRGFVAKAVVK